METIENRVSRYGKSFITNFAILVRTVGIYDSANETIINMAKRMLDDIDIFLEESGEFTLKIIEGSFYIEGVRIKAGVSDIEIFSSLAMEFKKKSVGVFDFRSPFTVDDLILLAYSLREGLDAAEIQAALEKKQAKNIMIGGPVVLQKEEGIDLKDRYAVAKRAYLKALLSVMEMNNSLKSGTRMKLKQIKRPIQLIIDCISTDESYLLGFTAERNVEDYYAFHAVNVAILSVILGKRAGLDRPQLRTLAISALFHDIGKTEVPSSILNKKIDFSPKELELIKRHPVDGIKILLKSFGLSETLILSLLVSYEHHMKADLSGYPEAGNTRKLNPFSHIVSIADDFDSLISGRVYERRKLGREDALRFMTQGSGTIYDPLLLKAFTGIFE